MRELRFQVRVADREIDIVAGRGQRLQLAGAGRARPAGVIHPQPLAVGEGIGESDGRRQIDEIVRDVDALRRVPAVEIHELHARSDIEIGLSMLKTIVQRDPVGVADEPVGIAEKTVEKHIAFCRFEIKGIVDRRAFVILNGCS